MSRRFYSSSATEPNMRLEFDSMLDGIFPEISKAQTHVIRKMRRQSTNPVSTPELRRKLKDTKQIPDFYVPTEGYLIPCECIHDWTGEPDIDHYCPICQGERYIWDESLIDCYKVELGSSIGNSTKEQIIPPGLTNTPLMVFYTKSSVLVTRADKIIEIWTDTEGEPIRPYRRKGLYRIGTAIDLRSDNGKLEYWKLTGYEEHRKFLNGPGG